MQEYMEEFNFDNPKVAEQFVDLIRRIVQREIRKLPYDKTYVATVNAVNGNLADIKLLDSQNVITGVKNKSGETIGVGDSVYIEAINNSLNNIYIKVKK